MKISRIIHYLRSRVPDDIKLFGNYMKKRLPALIVLVCTLLFLFGGDFGTTAMNARYIRIGLVTVVNAIGVAYGEHILIAIILEVVLAGTVLFM